MAIKRFPAWASECSPYDALSGASATKVAAGRSAGTVDRFALPAPQANLRADMTDEIKETFEPVAREGEYVAPSILGEAFHCMHCGVLSRRAWISLVTDASTPFNRVYSGYSRCVCRNCHDASIWNQSEERCVDPVIGGGPRPHVEMPEEHQGRLRGGTPNRRPITAGGLCAPQALRQKLCQDLGEKGEDIDKDIAGLVKKGLPRTYRRRWTRSG